MRTLAVIATDSVRTLAVIVILAAAVPAATVHAQPRLSGFLSLDKRYSIGGDSPVVANFYNRFRPEFSLTTGDRLYMVASLDARFYDLPDADSFVDLENAEMLFPLELSMWEGFVDVYGFLVDDLDIRVGKQRIAWGRADRLNPTDNLNPNDFSDLVEFGEKIPSWAVRATYYLNGPMVTLVWVPSPTPLLLPKNGASLILGDNIPVENARLEGAEGSSAGAKLDATLGRWDVSASYLYGYDDVPILSALFVENTDGAATFSLPRMQVIGVDAATELRGIGLWAEAAVFMPKKADAVTLATDGRIVARHRVLDGSSYLRSTVGGDYTFDGGLYVNTQWVHGFSTERGADLHDYLFAHGEKDILNDQVRVRIGGAVESTDAFRGAIGYGVFPELTYQAIDNFDLSFGAFIVDGGRSTLFGSWADVDQVYLRARIRF